MANRVDQIDEARDLGRCLKPVEVMGGHHALSHRELSLSGYHFLNLGKTFGFQRDLGWRLRLNWFEIFTLCSGRPNEVARGQSEFLRLVGFDLSVQGT